MTEQRENIGPIRQGVRWLLDLFLPSSGLMIGENRFFSKRDASGHQDPYWGRPDGTEMNLTGEALFCRCTSSLTLTTSSQSITGDGNSSKVRLLLPTIGEWLVSTTCDFHVGILGTGSAIGELFVSDGGSAETGAAIKEMVATDRATVNQQWKVTTTAANTPIELKARKDINDGSAQAITSHTTLSATIGAGGGSAVETTDHGTLTGRGDDDHTQYGQLADAETVSGAWTFSGAGEITLADGKSLNLQEALTFTGATTENLVEFPDNLANALSFMEGANPYLTFTTTNAGELITFGKSVVIPDAGYIGSASDPDAIQIEADGDVVLTQDLAVTGDITTVNSVTTHPTDSILKFIARHYVDNANLYPQVLMQKAKLGPAAVTANHYLGAFMYQGAVDGVPTFAIGAQVTAKATENWSAGNVGCQLSFWTAADGSATATERWVVQQDGTLAGQGTNDLTLGGDVTAANIVTAGNVDGVDVSAHDVATTGVHGAGANTLLHSASTTSALTTVGALDAGSITSNFGTIDTGASAIATTGALGAGETTLADGASLNLQEAITFTGATGENLIEIPDNLADALSVNQGVNTYLRFVTTDGFEAVAVLKTFAVLGNITVTGTVDGVDVAARDHAAAHGPSSHTEGNADKLLYLDNSGDEQEVALTAAGSQTAGYQYLRSTSATGAPELKEVMRTVSITMEDPEANDDIAVCFFFQAVTIREIEAVIVGTSCTIDPYHNTDRSAGGGATDVLSAATAITATTSYNIPGDGGTLNDVTIPADSWLIMEVTAETSCTEIAVTFRYTIDT